MKKLISLALALVMICAMATTAFATNYTDDAAFTITTSTASDATGSGTASTWNIDVTAGLEAETVTEADVAANYYVVVAWDITSDLVYSIGKDAYSWQVNDTDNNGVVENAGYVVDYSKGSWTGSAVIDVTVTNWSNRSVTAGVAFAPATKNADAGVAADITVANTVIDNASLTVDAASKDIEVADGKQTTSAATASSKVTLDSSTITAGGINKADAVIGVVTVTLTGIDTKYTTAGGQTTTTTPDTTT